MKRLILPFMMLGTMFSQTPADTKLVSIDELTKSGELQDPNFLRIINNYFGCKTWTDGFCTECSKSFYFNAKGVCCQIKQNCKEFNTEVGLCQTCYDGYAVIDSQCKRVDITNANRGCKAFKGGVCVECSQMFYSSGNGICTEIDSNCRLWQKDGICNECYRGYLPQGRKCLIDNTRDTKAILQLYGDKAYGPNGQVLKLTEINKLCAQWNGVNCIRCAQRTFLNSNLLCQSVDDQCNTWDRINGLCLTCYKGYDLSRGRCQTRIVQVNQNYITINGITGVDSNNDGVLDFCKIWQGDICLECANRAYFDSNLVCQPVSDLCKSFSAINGKCTQCYIGYQLNSQNGTCERSTVDLSQPSDLGCKTWDWQKQICLQCSQRWIFNQRNVCVPQDDLCEVFLGNGNCQKCYAGYQIGNNGLCVKSAIVQVSDLGCKTWDWQRQICQECSARWRFNGQGKCVPLDDNCEQFGSNQNCVKCYKGFKLENNTCVIDRRQVSDLGCKIWDWDRQICLQCSERWYFDTQGRCAAIPDLCSKFTSGRCTQCFKGYRLNSTNQCVIDQTVQQVSDLGCKTWDWVNQICLQCSARWYFNAQRRCVAIPESCKTFTGERCTQCFKGYRLNLSNQCEIDQTVQQVSDIGCKNWDWDNQICLQCSARWYFNAQGICAPVNDFCSKHVNGVCSECFKGYILNQGLCVLRGQIQVADLGCKNWDWDNQICLQCSARWYFNSQGKCTAVDNNCDQFNRNGVCTKCYKGYLIQNNQCVLGNPLCKESDSQGRCITCYNGFVLYKNNCIALQKIAHKALYYAECCPEKLAELQKN